MTAQNNDLEFHIKMPINIRKVQQEDLPKLEWQGEFSHYRNLFLKTYQEQQRGNRLILVADCRTYPIGRLFMQFRSSNGVLADGKTKGYIYSFHVMGLFRGCGIGSRMLKIAENIFSQQHYQYVTIAVAKDNAGALRLYKRHGYRIYGQHDGRWQYHDHNDELQRVHEPAWLLKKVL